MISRQVKLQESTHFRVMRMLQENPSLARRKLVEKLGASDGGLNCCLKAVMQKGSVKMKNFVASNNNFGYVYVLTPIGMLKMAAITYRFLRRKIDEYDDLRAELQSLKNEAAAISQKGRSHET